LRLTSFRLPRVCTMRCLIDAQLVMRAAKASSRRGTGSAG
jgi:hypothetical protein